MENMLQAGGHPHASQYTGLTYENKFEMKTYIPYGLEKGRSGGGVGHFGSIVQSRYYAEYEKSKMAGRPEFIVDSESLVEGSIKAVWGGVPVEDCHLWARTRLYPVMSKSCLEFPMREDKYVGRNLPLVIPDTFFSPIRPDSMWDVPAFREIALVSEYGPEPEAQKVEYLSFVSGQVVLIMTKEFSDNAGQRSVMEPPSDEPVQCMLKQTLDCRLKNQFRRVVQVDLALPQARLSEGCAMFVIVESRAHEVRLGLDGWLKELARAGRGKDDKTPLFDFIYDTCKRGVDVNIFFKHPYDMRMPIKECCNRVYKRKFTEYRYHYGNLPNSP